MIPKKVLQFNNKSRIVTIGELLVEFIPCNPNGKLSESGEMIKTASGSSGIFAAAVAQLGTESGFIGQIGRDLLSQFVINVVNEQGVDTKCIKVADDGQIGLSFVEYMENGRNFQYYRDNSVGSLLDENGVDDEYISESAVLHYPGMLLELSQSMQRACIKAVNVARKNGVMVSFDPNIRKELIQKEGAVDRLKWAVAQSDIISPTLDEAKFITGEEDINKIINKLHAMGPKIIAITQDENGSIISCQGECINFGGYKVDVIDPTGAGDTFSGAMLVGILKGWDLEKIGKFANAAGSLVCTKQGTIGLAIPTYEETIKWMNSNNSSIKKI